MTRLTCPRASWRSNTRSATISIHSAYGGSFLNHQWLIAAASQRCTTTCPRATTATSPTLTPTACSFSTRSGSAAGKYVRDGSITPVSGRRALRHLQRRSPRQASTVGGTTTNNAPDRLSGVAYDNGGSPVTYTQHYVVNTTRSVNLGGNGENGIPGYNTDGAHARSRYCPRRTTATRPTPTATPVLTSRPSATPSASRTSVGSGTPADSTSSRHTAARTRQRDDQPELLVGQRVRISSSTTTSRSSTIDNYAPFDTTNTVPTGLCRRLRGLRHGGPDRFGQSGVTRAAELERAHPGRAALLRRRVQQHTAERVFHQARGRQQRAPRLLGVADRSAARRQHRAGRAEQPHALGAYRDHHHL